MDDLHSLLQWQNPAQLEHACASLRLKHQGVIGEALGRLLARLTSGDAMLVDRAERLRDALDQLPADALERIVDAPETCFQLLRSAPEQALRFFEDAVSMERERFGEPTPALRPMWSASGDRYRPPASAAQLDEQSAGWLTRPMQRLEATTFSAIVIDFHSPYARRKLEQNNYRQDFAPAVPYRDADIEEVRPKVLGALAALAQIGGAPFLFVTHMLRTVMPRPEPGDLRFNGSSNRLYPGRANLFNPHLPYIDQANIANSLVHESVHTFLYLTEQRVMPVEDMQVLYQDLVESPWSKRRIHLLSYIHASFVWYGLYHFWRLPKVAATLPGHVRDYYLQSIQDGYANGAMLDGLMRFRGHIRPVLFDQLAALQETMLAQH